MLAFQGIKTDLRYAELTLEVRSQIDRQTENKAMWTRFKNQIHDHLVGLAKLDPGTQELTPPTQEEIAAYLDDVIKTLVSSR